MAFSRVVLLVLALFAGVAAAKEEAPLTDAVAPVAEEEVPLTDAVAPVAEEPREEEGKHLRQQKEAPEGASNPYVDSNKTGSALAWIFMFAAIVICWIECCGAGKKK